MRYAIYLFVFLLCSCLALAIGGTETMSINVATSMQTNASNSLMYTASATGSWAVMIESSLTGGCTFQTGAANYKYVLVSDEGNSKVVTIKSPSSAGTCILTGNYQFGNFSSVNFQSISIVVNAPDNQTLGGSSSSSSGGGTTDYYSNKIIVYLVILVILILIYQMKGKKKK